MNKTHLLVAVFITLTALNADRPAVWADEFFRQQVAPIFEHRCLSCHDDEEQKGGFSLQSAAAAMEGGYIEPGDAAASHLLELISPVDGQAQMPQDADPLSDEQIAAIKKWIDEGAKWPADFNLQEPVVTNFDWWSYRPLDQPMPPEIESPWIRTPIDAFILEQLRKRGLTRAAEADRRTLIRRLTFDLTGLPPSPRDVEKFVRDPDPQAYEKLVDRLLASPHYGERWARHWLDVVKYADTCGYDKDKLRPHAWPYRDYVIRSFNEDKPYARFVQEQIAGDVLFPHDPDGILGLGMIAAGPWDFIGHVEVPESKIDGQVARNLDRDDMVANVFNTFSSVTVQCARCHNHKFDPVTQDHYYGLQAIFAAVDRAERVYQRDAFVEQRRQRLDTELAQLQREADAIDQEIARAGGPLMKTVDHQIDALRSQLRVEKAPEFGYHSQIAEDADSLKWVEVEFAAPKLISKIVLHPCHDEFAGIGAGFGFPVRFKVEIGFDDGQWQTVSDQTGNDLANPALRAFSTKHHLTNVKRVRITVEKLAERRDDFILALAELEVLDDAGRNIALHAKVNSLDSIEAPNRWSREYLTDGVWAKAADESESVARELAALFERRGVLQSQVFTPERRGKRDSLTASIKAIQKERDALPGGKLVYAAATHFSPEGHFRPTRGKMRAIQVLRRGNVQQPMRPAIPGVLPFDEHGKYQLPAELNESERRAALAKWLTSKQHPLVWRSIVNRIWQYHFGEGIVATSNDFGRMGAQPTHPELLDWLAIQFRDRGQSIKALHRLIVTSSVYRQSSAYHAGNHAIDGSNQYLWRMNRRRLEAEEIRDSILAASGALNSKMGGPGYYLFKLERAEHSPHYEYHKFDPSDPESHRRSIYRFVVRSQPDPWMTTLDCADSSQSTPNRNETLTSLQALTLLNSRFNLAMAEIFAKRLSRESTSLPEQVDRAMAYLVQRSPSPAERDEMIAYAEQHGLTNLCRLLFNLSEFVYLD